MHLYVIFILHEYKEIGSGFILINIFKLDLNSLYVCTWLSFMLAHLHSPQFAWYKQVDKL